MSNSPRRKCLGCNQIFDKKDLVRIVRISEDKCIIDREQKANGISKGGYLCKDLTCLKKAIKKNVFTRYFKLSTDEVIISDLKNELENNE
ncbi:MAG: YlxR family protein [Lachnospiraceae bacterium]|nr:YlxR family protein [Lachnospiraceae bacterium]